MTLTFVVLALAVGQRFGECIKLDPSVDVGGDAQENEFPFMVQLQRYWVVSYLHECGGSLLTASWVLTAAHCNVNERKLQVLAGTVRRNDRINGQRRAVVRFLAHEQYILDGTTGPYDIALAEVEQPFDVDGVTVGIIGLPPPLEEDVELPEVLAVMGFGKINETDALPEVLQVVSARLHPPTDCGPKPPPVATVCVGSPGATACQGDSGGPVVGWSVDGVPQVFAVVSYGSQICGAKPITCTDVRAYGQWIRDTLLSASV